MEPSIFTRIINGEIPCHKVYEDENTFVIMDIHPIQPGMVVVISKEQTDNFEDLSDESSTAMIVTSKKLMKALRKVFPNKKKIAVRIEGLDVAHAHTVVYPIDNGDEYRADPVENADHDELEKIAEKIRGNL